MSSVWFEGVGQLNSAAVDLSRAGVRAQLRAPAVVSKTAHDIEATGKALCPVDTGNLRNSISSTVERDSAEIGPEASYGGYVEYGTSRMAPQAYMGPALDRHSGEFVDAMSQLTGRSLW